MHIHSLHQIQCSSTHTAVQLSFNLITKSTNSRKNGIQQILKTTNGWVSGTKVKLNECTCQRIQRIAHNSINNQFNRIFPCNW